MTVCQSELRCLADKLNCGAEAELSSVSIRVFVFYVGRTHPIFLAMAKKSVQSQKACENPKSKAIARRCSRSGRRWRNAVWRKELLICLRFQSRRRRVSGFGLYR